MRMIRAIAQGLLLLAGVASAASAQEKSRKGNARAASASQSSSPIIVDLSSRAPFKRLLLQPTASHSCPLNGCELTLIGVTASGQRSDVTFNDVLTNGFAGTRAQMIGAPDQHGMPRLTYEQGNLEGENTFNVFDFDASEGRYRFVGTVDAYGKTLTAPLPATRGLRLAAAATQPDRERKIAYAGTATYKSLTLVQGVELKIKGNIVEGMFGQRIFGQTVLSKLTGEISNGNCTLKIGQDTLVGPCDDAGFSGRRLSKSGNVVGTFDFKEKSTVLKDTLTR